MDKFSSINIREYLIQNTPDGIGEADLQVAISDFLCPKNLDVENFLDSVDNRYLYNTSKSRMESKQMPEDYHRHDISDEVWCLLEPLLPGRKGTWGGNARDNRKFINSVFWILRTGAPWRDLPPEYGSWNNVNRRFCRWRDKGVWERILEALIDDPDYEWLMIDASHIKVHPHASGAVGGSQDMARTKGGSTQRYILPWMRMVCRSEYISHQVPLLIVRKLAGLLRR